MLDTSSMLSSKTNQIQPITAINNGINTHKAQPKPTNLSCLFRAFFFSWTVSAYLDGVVKLLTISFTNPPQSSCVAYA